MSYSRHRAISKPLPGCSVDWTHPLSRSLKYHWLFNDGAGSGVTNIVSANGQGTCVAAPLWIGSPRGSALSFNGTTQYVNVPSFFWPGGSSVTVILWILSKRYSEGNHGSAFGTNAPGAVRFQAHITYDNTLMWDYGTTVNGRVQTAFGDSYFNKWTHVALLSAGNGGSYKAVYLNGILIAESTGSSDGPSDSRTGITLGAWVLDNNLYQKCFIDDFRIYNRVLSRGEIQQLYTDPYLNILSPSYRRYFAGGLSIPVAMASYRRMGGRQ